MTWLFSLLTGAWSRIVLWGAAALGVLIAIAGIYRSGKSAGRHEVIVKGLEDANEAGKTRIEIETRNAGLPDADVDERLRLQRERLRER